MMEINYYSIPIPVKFKISKTPAVYSIQIICEIKYEKYIGYGSSAAYMCWVNKLIDYQKLIKKTILTFFNIKAINEIRDQISKEFTSHCPSLVFATDTALLDLKGKIEGKKFDELFNTKFIREDIDITEQVFIPTNMKEYYKELHEIKGHGTKSIKVKVGFSPLKDIELISTVSDYFDNIDIKLDFNSAYENDTIILLIKELDKKGLKVSLLEDPLLSKNLEEYARLRKLIKIPIMLDSCIRTIDDVKTAINLNSLDLLNIKLNRVGGLYNAHNIVQICKKNKIPVSIGCAEDLGFGMATIINFSSIIENLYGTEGVGKNRLNIDYVNESFEIEKGKIHIFNRENGIGVTPNIDKLNNMLNRYKTYNLSKPSLERYLYYYMKLWNGRLYKFIYKMKRKLHKG